ncbi:MAG: TetR/AcrR family transcriptional regulator [Hyphomicrobiaceae bacterium]|nr:TetR/AcrR family transcriptional regulator [Hyphomicrobiaceae bacterium]
MTEKGPLAARAYHHGNLPEALAMAAEDLVRERGVHAFTLRECARRAGVAHSAPGHHFGDVTGLLTEVAARGFERLTQRMLTERADATGPAALSAIGRGYVGFALDDPAIFVLMFHSDRVDHGVERLRTAGLASYGVLRETVAAIEHAQDADPGTLDFAWSAIHGLAMLLIDEALPVHAAAPAGDRTAAAEATIARIVAAVTVHPR